MPRRLNTIIIVPHSQARFIKFSFSTRTLMAAGAAMVSAVILSIIAIAYSGNAVSRRADVQRPIGAVIRLTRVVVDVTETGVCDHRIHQNRDRKAPCAEM